MWKPSLVIGPPNRPYMLRWHLFRFRGWQLCLHKICRSDDARALHDHKAKNLSIILKNQYNEIREQGDRGQVYGPGNFIFRQAKDQHRLVLNKGEHVWTLWLRWPPTRRWGFIVPGHGWVDADDYHARWGEEDEAAI